MFFPVLESDPNGPWHDDKATGETWHVTVSRDPEIMEDVEDGGITIGSRVVLYAPYEGKGDAGWGEMVTVRKIWTHEDCVGFYTSRDVD